MGLPRPPFLIHSSCSHTPPGLLLCFFLLALTLNLLYTPFPLDGLFSPLECKLHEGRKGGCPVLCHHGGPQCCAQSEQVNQQKLPWSSAGTRRALQGAACHFSCHASLFCGLSVYAPASSHISVSGLRLFDGVRSIPQGRCPRVYAFTPRARPWGTAVSKSTHASVCSRAVSVPRERKPRRGCGAGRAGEKAVLFVQDGQAICWTSAAGTREQQMQGPRGRSTVPGPRGWLHGRSQEAAGGLAELLTPVQSRAELCAQGREELTCPVWTTVGSGEAGGPVWKLPWTGCR